MFNFIARWLFLFLLMPLGLFADALVVTRAMKASTIAEVLIEKDNVRLQLEISVPDLPAFQSILPSQIHEQMGFGTEPVSQRLERFFSEELTVKADGLILPGAVRQMEPRSRVERDEVTGEPLPNQGAAEDVLFVELVYPFEGRPQTLAFKPPMNEQGYVDAPIGFMTYHHGLPVMDFRYLSRNE